MRPSLRSCALLCALLAMPACAFMFRTASVCRNAQRLMHPGLRARPLRTHAHMSVDGPVRVRFAPSPTGTLHVGGARTALFNWLLARKTNGQFIIRVEDTDEARSTRQSEETILGDLRWLGLDWDEGPDVGGPHGPYRQSERKDLYMQVAKSLIEKGLAYPCFSTEEELEAMRAQAEADGKPPQYDGRWRNADPELVKQKLAAGDPHTIRFKVPPNTVVGIDDYVRGRVQWDAEASLGDFIVLRSNGMPVYNFCVAVDDALMKITHVIRAEEHLTNTLRQLLILDALGYPHPKYAHCSLILGEDRSKLSKRHGATSVTQYREQGFLPVGMLNYLALLGWNDGSEKELFDRSELVSAFDLTRVVKSSAVFDSAKLKWINSQHLKVLSDNELASLAAEKLRTNKVLPESPVNSELENSFVSQSLSIAKGSMEVVNDVVKACHEVFEYPLSQTVSSDDAKEILEDNFTEVATAVLAAHENGELPTCSGDDFAASWKEWVKVTGKSLGRKGKRLFHPLRLALTGRMSGPDIGEQLRLLHLAGACGCAGVTDLSERMVALRDVISKAHTPAEI